MSCCTVVTLRQVKSESLAHGARLSSHCIMREDVHVLDSSLVCDVNSHLGWKWLNSVFHNTRVFLFAVCTVLFYIQFSFLERLVSGLSLMCPGMEFSYLFPLLYLLIPPFFLCVCGFS